MAVIMETRISIVPLPHPGALPGSTAIHPPADPFAAAASPTDTFESSARPVGGRLLAPRVERLPGRAPTIQAASTAPPRAVGRLSSDPADPHFERTAIAERMLVRGTPDRDFALEMVEEVQPAFERIPLEVLRILDRNHVALAVKRPTDSLESLGVIRPLEVQATYADLPGLAGLVRDVGLQAEALYREPLENVEGECRRVCALAIANPDFQRMRDDLLPGLLEQRAYLLAYRRRWFGRELQERSGGRLEALPLRNQRSLIPAEIAREHGALSEEERQEFTSLLSTLNAPSPDSPRPVPSDLVAVPSYSYDRSSDDADERPRVLSGHDAGSLEDWEKGGVRGQYWYLGKVNTVVIRRDVLEQGWENGHFDLIHELGHAYEEAMRELDPAFFETYRHHRNSDFERLEARGPEAFVTRYASTGPSEMAAESFAIYYTSTRPNRVLRASDRDWSSHFRALVGRARRVDAAATGAVGCLGAPGAALRSMWECLLGCVRGDWGVRQDA